MSRLMPRQPVPALRVPTIHGDIWDISEQHPDHFSLILFYRGLHCPMCRMQLKDLSANLSALAQRGVGVVAISTDDKERAYKVHETWDVGDLILGYDLSIETAREWGLYISSSRGVTSIGVEEPPLFAEPGLFLLRPDHTLYTAWISTMPFARPSIKELLGSLDFIIQNDYPARGEA